MWCRRFLFLISCTLFVSVCNVNAGGETLVLLDNLAIKETHSMFFKSLKGKIKIENTVTYNVSQKCR